MRKTEKSENRKPLQINGLFHGVSTALCGTVLFCMVAGRIDAQSPPVVWNRQIAGPFGTCQYAGVALDQQDDFYFTASFVPQTFLIGNQTLTNRAMYAGLWAQNGFLAKYSRTGDFIWSRQIGGTGSDNANYCATDASGNIFVTGTFSSSNVILGGVVLTNLTANTASCFLAKYDSQGNLLWARQSSFGAAPVQAGSLVMGTSVAADANDNVWLAGTFDSSNAIFGTNVLVNPDYNGPGSPYQNFLVKYDSDGNVVWAKMAAVHGDGGANPPANPFIGLDANSNTFFCSDFIGVAGLGTIPVTNVSRSLAAVLLAKFDPAGNVVWAEQAAYLSNNGVAFPGGVATDAEGNCRVAGTYWGGAVIFPSTVLPAPPQYVNNGYIAKFDASGNFVWAADSPGQFAGQVSVDGIGNSYFVGFAAISKYAGDGTLLWTTNSLGLWGPTTGTADQAGTLFVVGSNDGNGDGFSAAQLSGPTLNIQPAGNRVVISWPTNEAGLGLESAFDLSGLWSPMTNPSPAVAGNLYIVTNDVSAGSRYYRLKNF